MKASQDVIRQFTSNGWFCSKGAYVLVDGQYGSTGKGLLASVMAEAGAGLISTVTTNAGPNSGHTAYSPVDSQKIVTQQIPIAGVVLHQMGHAPVVYMNAGSVINPDIFLTEAELIAKSRISVSPFAAVIDPEDLVTEAFGSPSQIASTAKGVGSAIARKVMRGAPLAHQCDKLQPFMHRNHIEWGGQVIEQSWERRVTLVEVPQGYSLGINSGFYPYTTSRECTVMQAMADARIHPNLHCKTISCYRTYPIRVGNTDKGNSGPVYPDQVEMTWEELGQMPEKTTVTGRVRRVFTWSWIQFRESLVINRPDALFINFMNYIKHDAEPFMLQVYRVYQDTLGYEPEFILTGWGPLNSDVKVY